ncbi:MAG TPA: vitamin B12 dependent-methionine synthase activation domain-containing protein [Spirochaetota bacterium]|nr:vitamin B12 dependent-methionine synthase activation domain-containing protein [Spirochaetota bacterium]
MIHIINKIPYKPDNDAHAAGLRLKPDSADLQDFLKLKKIVETKASPKIIYKEAYITGRRQHSITIDTVQFNSLVLRKNLTDIEKVFCYIVTCGRELETVKTEKNNFLAGYWLDYLMEDVLNHAHLYLKEHIRRKYKTAPLSTMNPGAGHAKLWPIEEQKQLFALFNNREKDIGVSLTKSFLMLPRKSTSGIFFPSAKSFQSCQLCRRSRCPGRSTAFDPALWQKMQNDKP